MEQVEQYYNTNILEFKTKDKGSFYTDIMLELVQAKNADDGDIMQKINEVAYVKEKHQQKISQVTSGDKKGYWKTHYYSDGTRKVLLRKDKYDIIHFLYEYYKKGELNKKTFGEVYRELESYKRDQEGCSDKTVLDYDNYFQRFMQPLAKMDISTITEDDLRKWIISDVTKQKPIESALKRLYLYLRKAFDYAKKHHYITDNPADYIDIAPYKKFCAHAYKADADTYFSPEEVEKIKEEMNKNTGNPRALIVLLCCETGMRAGEVVALYKEDVKDGYLEIHRQQIRDDTTTPYTFIDVDYTKDTRCKPTSPRLFPITPEIDRILGLAEAVDGAIESPYLFHDQSGKMVSKDSYEQYLRRHCRYIGLGKTNNHALRKGINNNVFIPLGFAPNERAALLGQTVRTNEQYYSLRKTDKLKELGDALANVSNFGDPLQ